MLTAFHPDLHIHRVPYRALGLPIGRQLVVVRLPSNELWIHSPIPWSPALREAVWHLGEVGHVVGPNRFHDECLREFQAEYPRADFHAAPGLAHARRDIRFQPEPLGNTPPAAWAGVLDQHLVAGMPRLNEIVFLHRPSRTLIIADLAFNLGPDGPWLLALIMKLNHAWGRFTPTRFSKSMMKDRAAVRASIEHILTWDFDRILVGHGANIETNGKAALREAFAFLK
jgi:hypothetical protein